MIMILKNKIKNIQKNIFGMKNQYLLFWKIQQNEFKQKIPNKYKKLSGMNLKELKESLTKLESNHIYDYNKETNKIYKFFASFYEKVEAIDYLLKTNQSNESQNISAFYDRRD